jgi:hypothetical protein
MVNVQESGCVLWDRRGDAFQGHPQVEHSFERQRTPLHLSRTRIFPRFRWHRQQESRQTILERGPSYRGPLHT